MFFISQCYRIIGFFMKRSAPFEDRDDYELMRNLNQQYESNFEISKALVLVDSNQLAELEREYQDKPGL